MMPTIAIRRMKDGESYSAGRGRSGKEACLGNDGASEAHQGETWPSQEMAWHSFSVR